MRILAIADVEAKKYWDYYKPGVLEGVDVIVSCGDLDPRYLSFLATFTHAPVVYVHGNHDEKYERIPPDGCISLEDRIWVYQGVRILGLGGSMKYRMGTYQYTDEEMEQRVRKLWLQLKRYEGFDILVAHAPALGIGDGEDLPHRGFKALRELLDKYHPRYFLHGHVHPTYGRQYGRWKTYGDTFIINAYDSYCFEYETEYEEQFEKVREKENRTK